MKVIRHLTLAILVAVTAAASAQNPIRLIFSNTDVSDVLRAISLKTGANIVYSAQETIPISLNITARNAEEAVRATSAAAGLMYKKIGSTLIVASSANMRKAIEPYGTKAYLTINGPSASDVAKQLEEMLPWLTARAAGTQVLVIGDAYDIEEAKRQIPGIEVRYRMNQKVNEVVFLKYATASQVVAMLKNMYPGVTADALGATDKQGGGIGLSGGRSEVEDAKAMIQMVDVPLSAMQPDVDFHVYNIKYSSAPVLKQFIENSGVEVVAIIGPHTYLPPNPGFRTLTGLQLGNQSGTGGNVNQGAVGGAAAGTSTTAADPKKEGDTAKMLVLRGTRDQISKILALLEAVDVKPIQVMVQVRVLDASPERLTELGVKWSWDTFSIFELPPGTGTTGAALTTTRRMGFGQFSRLPWNIDAILGAMVTNKDAKLLADPKVQVTDNDEASIFIGSTIRARIAQTGALGAQTVQIVEFPVGIILLIRPRVNADGNITMRVHPVVSTVTALDEDNVPQTNSREAETTVMVKDGETMVIGGLISEELSKTVMAVPILSEIPILGELFKHRSVNKKKSEILVFITPKLVKDGVPSPEDGAKGGGSGGEKKKG
jgi:type II secretory pathway component GspD/PulD (secretin)